MSQPLPLPPFKAFLASNIPSVYDNTLSYYDELTKLIGYIETVILPTVNTNTTDIEKLNESFKQLKSYVDNYFNNLDVQEEINNKLDEMAEDGTLQEIVATYLQSNVTWTFDNIADMQSATNLIAGSYAKTLGKDEVNDGEGAYYYISDESGDIELANDLYAVLVNDYTNNYYDEIKLDSEIVKDSNGNFKSIYYTAEIPVMDKFNSPITLHVVDKDHMTPSEYAQKHYSTLTTNASLAWETPPNVWQDGIVIGDGVVLHEYDGANYPSGYGAYLGIKDNNVIKQYPKNTTSATMLADGVKQCIFCFGAIVLNSEVNEDAYHLDEGSISFALGQKADGTIILFGNEGRGTESYGLTPREVAEILISKECVNAWELDGGGSFSMSYHGTKINRDYDDNRTSERKISYLFNVQHIINNKREAIDVSNQGMISKIKDQMNQAQFSETEKKHNYVAFRVNESQNVQNGQVETQKLTLRSSAPYDVDNGRITPSYDGDENLVGFKCNLKCYMKANFTLQLENNTSNAMNVYVGLFVGNSKEYQLSNILGANEFKSINLDFLTNINQDVEKEISIRVWGNMASSTDVTVTRGVGYIEFIPNKNTY